MCSLLYSSLTCLGTNPHTCAKLGLLLNNTCTHSGSAGNPIITVPKKLFNKAKKHFGFLPPKRNGTSPGDMLSGDTPDDCASTISPSYKTASRISLFACIVTLENSNLCLASSLASMTPSSWLSILSSRSLACLWLNSYNAL